MRYLLDTNTCIAVMRNHPHVVRHMSTVAPADCAVSTITSFELYTGVEKCSDPTRERVKVDLLLNTVHVAPFDSGAAQESARVRALLEAHGQAIGPYDTLLAGHALSLPLILAYLAHEHENLDYFRSWFLQKSRVLSSGNAVLAL